jgi:uncharacterized membrane protein (DUF4010 family)
MSQAAAVGGHWTLAVSLGIGLLIGIERERTKGEGAERRPAGVRTFALVGLLGGLCATFDDRVVLGVGAGFVGLAAIAGYLRSTRKDPGLTTEIALLVAFLLGALARDAAALASALGVVVTILLVSRTRLHTFAGTVLSEDELHDGLLFAAAALVVLPLVPDRPVGPYAVFNPFTVWRLVVIVMAISVFGYVARRILGPRYGLPLAGLAGGFVSAAATIGAMAGRAKREPSLAAPAAAGAMLANVATIALMAVLLGATSPPTLRQLTIPLVGAGLAAIVAGAVATIRAWRAEGDGHEEQGRAFDLRTAVAFALTLTAILLVSATLTDLLGSGGLVLASAVAGFADTHSAAIAAAALVASGDANAHQAAIAVLAALSTNTVTKVVVARLAGTWRFAGALAPGLVAMLTLAWLGAAVS